MVEENNVEPDHARADGGEEADEQLVLELLLLVVARVRQRDYSIHEGVQLFHRHCSTAHPSALWSAAFVVFGILRILFFADYS